MYLCVVAVPPTNGYILLHLFHIPAFLRLITNVLVADAYEPVIPVALIKA